MNFYKSLKLFVIFQMTTGCQNGQIPQFNSLEEAVQFAEENDIPLEDLPYRKWSRRKNVVILYYGWQMFPFFCFNFVRRPQNESLLASFCHPHSKNVTCIKSPTSMLLASNDHENIFETSNDSFGLFSWLSSKLTCCFLKINKQNAIQMSFFLNRVKCDLFWADRAIGNPKRDQI